MEIKVNWRGKTFTNSQKKGELRVEWKISMLAGVRSCMMGFLAVALSPQF